MLTQAPHRTESQHLSHAESRIGKELNASLSLQITAATLNTHPGFPLERHRTANSDSQHDRRWERCWQQHISQHCQAVSTEQLPGLCTPLNPWDCHLWLLKHLRFCLSYVRKNGFILLDTLGSERIPHSQGIFRRQLLCLVYKHWQRQDYIRNPNISLCVFQVKAPLRVGEINETEYSEKL